MARTYRVGAHHRVTIIESDDAETPDEGGRRPSDRLMATAQTVEDAEYIVTCLNLAEVGE